MMTKCDECDSPANYRDKKKSLCRLCWENYVRRSTNESAIGEDLESKHRKMNHAEWVGVDTVVRRLPPKLQ